MQRARVCLRFVLAELSVMAAQVASEAIESNSVPEVEISVVSAQELPVPRINNYGSVIAETEDSLVPVQDPERSNRSYCKCKSACKTKKKNGTGRGCPCRTANLPCDPPQCKCGTARKPCANKNIVVVSRENLPTSSLDRQRRDIENTAQQIEVRKNNLSTLLNFNSI
ncbi:uncharacterized protein LOC144665797 [Oculina patagonica]